LTLQVGGLEIVNIHEEFTGIRLAIVQTPTIYSALSLNLDLLRRILRYIETLNVKTVILPPFMPYGIPFVKPEEIDSVSIDKKNPYVRILKHIALQNRLFIISPYVYEKTKNGYYISNLLVDGESGIVRFFSRKITPSTSSAREVLKHGHKLEVVSDEYIYYSVLLDEDILVPEFARYLTARGVSQLITVSTSIVGENDLRLLLEALRLFTGISLVHIGYFVVKENITLAKAPTLIVLGNGEAYRFTSEKPLLVTIPLKLIRETSRKPSELKINIVLNTIIDHFKELRNKK